MLCQRLFEGCAMMRDLMRIGTLVLLLACVAPGTSQAKGIGWPEAVDRLARERSNAETCLALLKGYGNKEQIARLRLAYGEAKADFDAVIAGLVTALAGGGNPESLPKLETELVRGESGLRAFCDSVDDVVPSKGFLDEVVKAAAEPVINAVSEGVAAIYNNYRKDDAETRHAIQIKLEAAKWPEYGEVACNTAASSRAVAAVPLLKTLAEMASELEAMAPSKERIHREVALKEARISLMHDGWKPGWGNYDDFLRWVTEQAARDPPPPSIATAAAIYRGQAK
jgi:hypothetical protein